MSIDKNSEKGPRVRGGNPANNQQANWLQDYGLGILILL